MARVKPNKYMSVMDKIKAERQKLLKNKKKSKRDIFLLWGEYPSGWSQVKDLLLCLCLMSVLISHLQNIDLSQAFEKERTIFVNNVQIKPVEAKELQEEEKEEDIKKIVATVYRLESSGGKNDSCRKKGKFNGYGYAQHKTSWECYDTQEEVEHLVTKWFEKNLKNKTLSQALCFYNEGEKKDDCPYYQNYLVLTK